MIAANKKLINKAHQQQDYINSELQTVWLQ